MAEEQTRLQINRTYSMVRSAALMVALLHLLRGTQLDAQTPTKVVIDDFESGISTWTRNDKVKTDDPAADVLLVDIAATKPGPGGVPGSAGAGLFAFKAARNSWASASIRVDGARWAQLGAQRLVFWLNADGATEGVGMVLRGHYQGADGNVHEEVFELPPDPQTKKPIPIKLNLKQWRKVVIPLTDFRSADGSLPPRLNDVYLLQFVQRGTWSSRYFVVDQMQVEGNGVPLHQVVARGTGPLATGTPLPPGVTAVNVDYLRTQGRIRTSADISIGGAQPGSSVEFPLTQNVQFRKAVQTLAPKFVRLDAGTLSELIDSARPGFDFSHLVAAVKQVRALGLEPLVAVPNPPAWGLDERTYALFATQAARAVNTPRPQTVRYFELATAIDATSDVAALALYNRGRTGIKALSALYKVGGITAGSERSATLATLLRSAAGLDFMALQSFGAAAGQPAADVVFAAARDVNSLRTCATALDRSRWKNIPIFVTQSNLNSARTDTGEAADDRATQLLAAAWWSSYLSSASRVADQIFHNDATTPGWGLLDESSRAYPAYYALWMWNAFLPPGSVRVQAVTTRRAITAVAANTPTAHNLLLANTTDAEQTARITIRGFPVLRAARIRSLEDPQVGVHFEDLPKSPFQTVTLKPYAIAVLQFIEPPH